MSDVGKLVDAAIVRSPLGRKLGFVGEKVDDDRVRVRLPFADDVTTVPGVVHGGAIAALVDTAATASFWASESIAPGSRGTTIGFSIQYLSAGSGDLVADARVIRRGGSLCTGQVEVRDAKNQLVATATVTYKLSAPSQKQPSDPSALLAGLFQGKSLADQKALLATLERAGASLYRGFAEGERDARVRAELEAAALREEENARVLENDPKR